MDFALSRVQITQFWFSEVYSTFLSSAGHVNKYWYTRSRWKCMKLRLRDSTKPHYTDCTRRVRERQLPIGVRNDGFFDFWRGISAADVAHKRTSNRRRAARIKAVLWLADGLSVEWVAKFLFVDDVTVWRLHKEYREGGEDRLILMRNKGSVSELNPEQQAEFREYLIYHTYL